MKAHSHPNDSAITATINGAVMAPIVEPELNTPVANALSRLGNHSAVVFTAAGKLPAYPIPRMARMTLKPNTVLTAACNIPPRLQTKIVIV